MRGRAVLGTAVVALFVPSAILVALRESHRHGTQPEAATITAASLLQSVAAPAHGEDQAVAPAPGAAPEWKAEMSKPLSHSDPRSAAVESSLMDLEVSLASNMQAVRHRAWTQLLPELVARDAPAAARFAEIHPSPQVREELQRRVAHLWAAQDAESAVLWAETLTDANDRDAAIADICAQVAQTDPGKAVQIRERHAPAVERDLTLENLVQQWASHDLSAALKWVGARTQGMHRDLLLERIAFVQSQTAPSDAARLVIDYIPPGEIRAEAAMTVLHQWAARDPEAAADWANGFPDSELRSRALTELAITYPR